MRPEVGEQSITRKLNFQSAPADNPLKGFLPFRSDYGDAFPHSMEWDYFGLNELMDGMDSFKFDDEFEMSLKDVASRGHQLVMRVYLDYPGKATGVPKFLIDNGLTMRPYQDHGGGQSPDYGNEELIKALESFIAAFGRQYDGDPRIGFITVGLLGFWGEWHTFPHENWFANEVMQNRVLHAYTNAFTRTRLLVRLPYADGKTLPIGFHDDSFTFSTLPTIDWHFQSVLERAGVLDRWQTQPIGGELRPEFQSLIWKRPIPDDAKIEDFGECVRQTHCSWLINQRAFSEKLSDDERDRAIGGAQSLGYELHIAEVTLPAGPHDQAIEFTVKIENRGVAPFYYDWPVQLRLQQEGNEAVLLKPDWKLTSVLPGAAVVMSHTEDKAGLKAGACRASLRVVNSLNNGKRFHFANRGQGADGWLDLGEFALR